MVRCRHHPGLCRGPVMMGWRRLEGRVSHPRLWMCPMMGSRWGRNGVLRDWVPRRLRLARMLLAGECLARMWLARHRVESLLLKRLLAFQIPRDGSILSRGRSRAGAIDAARSHGGGHLDGGRLPSSPQEFLLSDRTPWLHARRMRGLRMLRSQSMLLE